MSLIIRYQNSINHVAYGSAIDVFDVTESVATENGNSDANAAEASSIAIAFDSGYGNGTNGYSYVSKKLAFQCGKFVSKFVDRVCIEGNLNEIE
jgi:hypothetical protein